MAMELAGRRVGGGDASSARTQKPARESLLEGKAARGRGSFAASEASVIVDTPGQRRLQERMKAELEAVRDLHRKALLLRRRGGAAPAGKGDARLPSAGPRREAPSEAAAKRRTSPTKPTPAVAHQIKSAKQQQQHLSQRAVAAAPVPERRIEKTKKEVEERRRRMEEEEEIARAREEWRRLVSAMEMAALPDETVYPHELEELGIAPYEYAVTRTRSQAVSQHRMLVGAAA
ncbi:unnamed protein product [Urochloa humidicola]